MQLQSICRRHPASRIHPHIQRRIKAETESAAAIVNLRRRNPQIKKRTVNLIDAQFIQGRLKCFKTIVYDTDTSILRRQLIGYRNRLGVFIKNNQTTLLTQTRQNQPGMPSPTDVPST